LLAYAELRSAIANAALAAEAERVGLTLHTVHTTHSTTIVQLQIARDAAHKG
jgi:hypothetical protein